MRRVLTLLTLVLALLTVSACHFDVNLSIDASAEISYNNGDLIRIDPVSFEGFHHNILTDSELEQIFIDLTRNVNPDFQTAVLHLAVFDAFSGSYLRDEDYAVVYSSYTGHYDFAELY